MSCLTYSDCEKMLAVAGDLYSVRDRDQLPQLVLRGLKSVIPHEIGGCHLIDRTRRQIVACYDPVRPPLPSQHKEFWRLSETHPLKPILFSNPSRAWKLSDVISRQAFHSTEFYNALYRPLRIDCELVAVLPDSQTPDSSHLLISLHRYRSDFTEHERALLNLLLSHVSAVTHRLRSNGADCARTSIALEDEEPFCEWLQAHTKWGLTRREREVLYWLQQGKTNSEIGRILGIAERTAETHALRIYPKMGVENRFTAIVTLNRLATAPVH